MSMTVVMAVGPKDVELAIRNLGWSAAMGRQNIQLRLVLSEALREAEVKALVGYAIAGWESVEIREVWELYPQSGWPIGPNAAFLTAAHWMGRSTAESWFFWEPDAIPVRAGWAESLKREYRMRGGGGVMGVIMPACPLGTYTPHVGGVAIYPKRTWLEAGRLLTNMEKAFDLAIAPWAIPIAHGTRAIQQAWLDGGRSVTFNGVGDLRQISDEAVIFHREKTGVLITLLRERLPLPLNLIGKVETHGNRGVHGYSPVTGVGGDIKGGGWG